MAIPFLNISATLIIFIASWHSQSHNHLHISRTIFSDRKRNHGNQTKVQPTTVSTSF